MIFPRRLVLGAAVLAAVFVFDVYCHVRPPGRIVALCGGAAGGVARDGGLVARWVPPAGLDLATLRDRFAKRGTGAALVSDGDALRVEVPGVREADVAEVTDMMTQGGIEFRRVVESTAASELIALGLAYDTPRDGEPAREPTFEVDQWRPESGGGTITDYYLWADSRDLLASAFAAAARQGWHPPPHTVIAYERIEPAPDARDPRVTWRSYFLSDEVSLDGMAVANAVGATDPNTDRPIVLLEFTREGGKTFGDVTAAMVGHKLATVIGDEVRSAPIINGAIRGGRAQITMGGSDHHEMERERNALVSTLEAGTLPLGGRILESHWVPPARGAAEWLARIVLGLGAGVLAAGLAWLVLAIARPERRIAFQTEGTGGRGKRLAWTLLAVAIYAIGTTITIPWLNDVELAHILARGAAHGSGAGRGLAYATIFGLGLAPLLSAFILVELVASVVPALRKYRDGDAQRRRPLGLAVASLTLVLATAQAYFVVKYLDQLTYFDVDIVDPGMRWPTIATLVAGTMVLAWLAALVSERGIGNGYAVLTIASWLVGMFRYWWWEGPLVPSHLLLAAMAGIAIAAIVLAMSSWRVRSPRSVAVPIPVSGITPLNPGAGAMLVVVQLIALGVAAPTSVLDALTAIQAGKGLGVVAVVATTAACALAFAWPGRRRAELARMGREPADARVWGRATMLSATVLLAMFALAHTATALAPELAFVVDPLVLVLVVASIADVAAEWRARRRDLVAVWPLHDPLLIDAVSEQLAEAGIPHHLQATRLRSLLWLFGAFAPMMVLVPREHGAEAQRLLHAALDPAG